MCIRDSPTAAPRISVDVRVIQLVFRQKHDKAEEADSTNQMNKDSLALTTDWPFQIHKRFSCL